MKRRSFTAMLGAAGLTPALLSVAAPASVAIGYNRYTYGLAVFHARTRASVTAADLVARLKVSAARAEAMMGEMTAKGVITPLLNVKNGVMRAIDPQFRSMPAERLRCAARKVADWLEDEEPGRGRTRAPGQAPTYEAGEIQEPENGQV